MIALIVIKSRLNHFVSSISTIRN